MSQGSGVTDRRAARHEATKARILAAAWELAAEQGLAGISLRDLAARVDLRQPSLYSYFASKHALYDAMFAQGYSQLLERMHARRFSDDPRVAVKEMARAVMELALENVPRCQLLFQRIVPGFEPSPASYALAQEFLDEAKSRLAAAGIRGARSLDLYTALISGLINQQLANDPGGSRWVRLVDEATDMYLAHATSN
jgi:AcrR family transcriptional regulator